MMVCEPDDIYSMKKLIHHILWQHYPGLQQVDKENVEAEVYAYITSSQKQVNAWYLSELVKHRANNYKTRMRSVPTATQELDASFSDIPYDEISDIKRDLYSAESELVDLLIYYPKQKEIAEHLGVTEGRVSQMVDELKTKIKRLLLDN